MPAATPASRRPRRTSAFTLIELIVVVIIIAVLAAIGAVAYNQYAAKARDTELVASATNIAHAITAKAAQDDLTTDAEAASVWPADPSSGAGDAALKKAFATSYGGTLTYAPGAADGLAGTVDVAAATSDRHACIQLTVVTSLPATVHLGRCETGSTGTDGGGPGGTGTGTGDAAKVAIVTAASGHNAAIPVTWTPTTAVTGTYTATCVAAADGDTQTATAAATTDSVTVEHVQNFVTYTCQVTGTNTDGSSVPAANSLDATPSVDPEQTLAPCTGLEAQPTGTSGTECVTTISEDPTGPTPPVAGYGPPPADTAGNGLWGVTSFPSGDVDPPHVFYVTNHNNGAVYDIYQSANPASSTATTVPATVGYLFDPGTFARPAGEVTGPSPLTTGHGITTLYIVDSGHAGQSDGSVWRVDTFAHTRHKVASGLNNPTEVTGFACYDATGTATSGVCLYVTTDSGIVRLTLGSNGAASSTRTLTTSAATGVRLTASGTLLVSGSNGTVTGVDPGTGTTVSTRWDSSGHTLGGIYASPVGNVVADTSAGTLRTVDGATVLASGLDSPRDVHDHWNAPWEYFTQPNALKAVNTSTGQIVTVWQFPGLLTPAGTYGSNSAWSVAFSPKDPYLVAANYSAGTLSEFVAKSAPTTLTTVATPYAAYNPTEGAFSPNGKFFAHSNNGYLSAQVVTWTINRATASTGFLNSIGLFDAGSGSSLRSLTYSPDSTLLAATDWNHNTVVVWQVNSTGSLSGLRTYPVGASPRGVAFSPDGKTLVVANGGGSTASVFTVNADGTLASRPAIATGTAPRGVTFSPDGSLLTVANSGSGTVSVFTTAGGTLTLLRTLSTGTTPEIATFSPDGRLVAVPDFTLSKVTIWAVSDGGALTQIGTYPTGTGPYEATFSYDGKLLAVANTSGSGVTLYQVS